MPDLDDRHSKRAPRARDMTDGARVGDLIRFQKSLVVLCSGCQRSHTVDLGGLADRVGYDVTLLTIRPRAKCDWCGARPRFKILD